MSNVVAHSYNFEIETIITQFIALIDGAIVIRYDVDEETKERKFVDSIKPWYAFGPKHRVMHSLVNKAKTYSLPFVAINITGIEGNTDRIAAKHLPIKRYNGKHLLGYDRPTPITISVQVTITTDRMTDLYQIYSKLSTQFQPYCSFSWYVPASRTTDRTDWEELTGKAEWDFNISFDVKDQLQETDKEEYSGTMNFKITGWLFPTGKDKRGGIIYDIGTSNIIESELTHRVLGLHNMIKPLVSDAYRDENLDSYDNPREWNNGHPRIVNIFQLIKISDKKINYLLDSKRIQPIKLSEDKYITLDGYNMKYGDVLFVPTNPELLSTKLERVTYEYGSQTLFPERGGMNKKLPIVEGYKMNIVEQSQNKVTVNFEDIDYKGEFDIIVADNVDYDSTYDKLHKHFEAK